jgi:hypothetical protein
MAGVRNNVNAAITIVDMLPAQSTAVLGLESGTFDCRSYPHGSRFVAVFSEGAQTEGTLTFSVVDCDTSGGTYAAVADTYGTLVTGTSTSAATSLTQMQAFQPVAGRPFIKLKSVETVSVTTAVPVHFFIMVIPPALV